MSKRISAKVGEYTNQQNETKGKYVNLGVILSNQNGEFMLLDPTVNLSGVLQLQNQMDLASGKQASDRIMCGIYQDQPQGQQAPAQPQAQTPPPYTGNMGQPQQFQQAPSAAPQMQQQPMQQQAPVQNQGGYNDPSVPF
jgi:hypothetical protein